MDKSLLESIARASFESYKQHCIEEGREAPYETYDDQPETLKRSGLAQAADIARKIESVGCHIAQVGLDEGERILKFDNATVERLAIEEHDRWVNERTADGWAYGTVKDIDKKRSPYLVPWDELDEVTKDFDRQPVREIFSLLDLAELGVYRNSNEG